jgi:citrate lyase subunit alpha/citrate CoA-transferase
VVTIDELKEKAERHAGRRSPGFAGSDVVAVVEYRDGTVIDVVKAVN